MLSISVRHGTCSEAHLNCEGFSRKQNDDTVQVVPRGAASSRFRGLPANVLPGTKEIKLHLIN